MSLVARVQTMQKPCRTLFWVLRRARGLELDISSTYIHTLPPLFVVGAYICFTLLIEYSMLLQIAGTDLVP